LHTAAVAAAGKEEEEEEREEARAELPMLEGAGRRAVKRPSAR
jgi:hypothetical protein